MRISLSFTGPFMASLYPFCALVMLHLYSFRRSELGDFAYERMAATWPELRSLKLGAADVSGGKPIASVGCDRSTEALSISGEVACRV